MSANGSGKAGHPHAKEQPAPDSHAEKEPWCAAGRSENGAATVESSPAVPQKVNTELPSDPANPLVGIHPRDWKHVYTTACMLLFMPALFIINLSVPQLEIKCGTAAHGGVQPQRSTDAHYHTNPEHLVLKEKASFMNHILYDSIYMNCPEYENH